MVALLRWLLILIAVLAVIGVGAVAVFSDPDIPDAELVAKYGQPPSQFLTLASGARVHYRDQGQRNGPALVLLHGSNASLHTWEPWVRADRRSVPHDQPRPALARPDRRRPRRRLQPRSHGEIRRRIHDRPGRSSAFALAGNSMGGGVSARFALMHPERLTHLILVDAGGMPTTTPRDPGLGFRLARMPVLQNVMLYLTPRYLFDEGLKKAIVDDALVTPEMVDRYWELNRRAGNRAATLKRFQTPIGHLHPGQRRQDRDADAYPVGRCRHA